MWKIELQLCGYALGCHARAGELNTRRHGISDGRLMLRHQDFDPVLS